jgi:hypothetical protein
MSTPLTSDSGPLAIICFNLELFIHVQGSVNLTYDYDAKLLGMFTHIKTTDTNTFQDAKILQDFNTVSSQRGNSRRRKISNTGSSSGRRNSSFTSLIK